MFQKNAGMEYFSAQEGHITSFCWNFFSHSAEKLREGNHSMFQKNSRMEETYAEGGISLFLLKLFSSQCRKILWGESFKVSEICGHGKTL